MNENVRIAKELVRLAKMIAAAGEEEHGNSTSLGEVKKGIKDNIVKNPQGFMQWLSKNRTMKVKDYASQTETLVQLFDRLIKEYQSDTGDAPEQQ